MDSGAILTSIIGARIATISLAVGKDTKISEFRQQWIDALRADVAKYCSVSLALYRANVTYSMKEALNLYPNHPRRTADGTGDLLAGKIGALEAHSLLKLVEKAYVAVLPSRHHLSPRKIITPLHLGGIRLWERHTRPAQWHPFIHHCC